MQSSRQIVKTVVKTKFRKQDEIPGALKKKPNKVRGPRRGTDSWEESNGY